MKGREYGSGGRLLCPQDVTSTQLVSNWEVVVLVKEGDWFKEVNGGRQELNAEETVFVPVLTPNRFAETFCCVILKNHFHR